MWSGGAGGAGGCLAVWQVVEQYSCLLAELRAHCDWVSGMETSLASVRETPLAEHVDALQQQLNSVQVCATHCLLCTSSDPLPFYLPVLLPSGLLVLVSRHRETTSERSWSCGSVLWFCVHYCLLLAIRLSSLFTTALVKSWLGRVFLEQLSFFFAALFSKSSSINNCGWGPRPPRKSFGGHALAH